MLNKKGRLTAQEWEQIQRHPEIGARLTMPLGPWLGDWVRGVGEHHERWDGGGYPAGLRAEEISLAARIIAVADAFDVMTAARSYKDPLPAEAARAELVRCAGDQFDDRVVRAFVAVSIGRLRRVMGPSALLRRSRCSDRCCSRRRSAPPHPSRRPRSCSAAWPARPSSSPPRRPRLRSPRRPPARHRATRRRWGREGPTRTRRRGREDAGSVAPPPGGGGVTPRTGSPTPTTPTTDPPITIPPVPGPVGGGPTTTVPGVLAPVVDPVNEEVVDPLVDTVDGLVPGLRVDETVDDLRCLLPILGCP